MWVECPSHVQIAAQGGARRAQRIRRQWAAYAAGADIVVEKSIANLARLPFLATHFQPASFIYILRNGFAVAEGISRRARPRDWGNPAVERYSLTQCAQQWVAADNELQRHRDALPHLLTLRYEDLCDAPTRVLAQIAEIFIAQG